jgi:hypothetical protein
MPVRVTEETDNCCPCKIADKKKDIVKKYFSN